MGKKRLRTSGLNQKYRLVCRKSKAGCQLSFSKILKWLLFVVATRECIKDMGDFQLFQP